MWIFTEVGFFSVVQAKEPDRLMIRTRNPKDLDLLRKVYLPELTATVETPSRDYPARAFATKQEFAIAMGRMAASIDYTNFKDHIHDLDPDRVTHYTKVWGVMNASTPGGRTYGYQGRLFDTADVDRGPGPKRAEESAQVFLGGGSDAAGKNVAGSDSEEDDLKTEEDIKQFLAEWYGIDPSDVTDHLMGESKELVAELRANGLHLVTPEEEAGTDNWIDASDDVYMR